jgi:hypothetical protein
MPLQIDTTLGKQIMIGIGQEDHALLDSDMPIACALAGEWTEQDVAEFHKLSHITIKKRKYRIVSPLRRGSFTVALDE